MPPYPYLSHDFRNPFKISFVYTFAIEVNVHIFDFRCFSLPFMLNIVIFKHRNGGFENREKDKDKGACTKQNRSVVRGSNVIMSDFY